MYWEHLEADISMRSANHGLGPKHGHVPPSQHEPRRLINSSYGQVGHRYYVLRRINIGIQPDTVPAVAVLLATVLRVAKIDAVFSGRLGEDTGHRVLPGALGPQCIAIIGRGAKLLVLLCAEGSDSILALPLSPLPALALALPVRLLIGAFGGGKGLLTPACCST